MAAAVQPDGQSGAVSGGVTVAWLRTQDRAPQGPSTRHRIVSFLLDTNVASEWTTPRPDRGFVESGTPIVPPPALAVAGPTASGKSALALELAERLRGTIINADAMQVYRELRVLTARPSPQDEARVTHAPVWGPPGRGSRAVSRGGARRRWRRWRARAAGRLPILTGGTGLYFAALTDGLGGYSRSRSRRARRRRAAC